MAKSQYTIELPAAVGRRVNQAAKRERRDPSELAVEALQLYFSLATETPTAAEIRAIRRGEAAFRRGDYITLDDYLRSHTVGSAPRRTRKKVS